jgi:hypothetical protein
MPELWRHMVELSVELEKLDDAGNYRREPDAARRRGTPQRQLQAGPQTRPVIEHQNHLSRILDVIPGPPQDYPPGRPNLPARQDAASRPPPNYHPNLSRLPAYHNERAGQGYARRVTQIDVVPVGQEWRPRTIRAIQAPPERKSNEWRNYMLASCFGAVMGISGYTFLSQAGLPQGPAGRAPAPPAAVAIAAQQPRVAPDDAFRERVSNQLFRTDAPGAGLSYGNPLYRGDTPGSGPGYGAVAQSPSDARLEPVSSPLPPTNAPLVQAPITIPQLSDDALLGQASYKLGHGDVAGARAAFETVAQHGSSLGAFGLAETYDPNVLARRRNLGLKPDVMLARMWYEKAARLGNAEASQRLKKLTKPPKAASLPKPAPAPRLVAPAQAVSSGSEIVRAR